MHVPRWAWLSLVLVLLPGCAGRMERTVRRRAAYDLSCPKESLAVEAVKERNFAVSVYGAKGCERREEYLVRCAVLSCTTEKTSEIAAREALREAQVVIVVAGMEGALPSVVGGLVMNPVIAVPTSVGYGASFGGLAALLGMLNSCASGVTVVNIDNGFGAAFSASLINGL